MALHVPPGVLKHLQDEARRSQGDRRIVTVRAIIRVRRRDGQRQRSRSLEIPELNSVEISERPPFHESLLDRSSLSDGRPRRPADMKSTIWTALALGVLAAVSGAQTMPTCAVRQYANIVSYGREEETN